MLSAVPNNLKKASECKLLRPSFQNCICSFKSIQKASECKF